ncbi:MAG: CvpA family protein [Planctomycetes bacterium]|nr:CvpA family protein [Planctomycetota bacterium]
MLTALTILIMLIVAYSAFREGIFTSLTILVNILLAGVVTFNFWEPLCGLAEPMIGGGFLDDYLDFIFMIALFCITLALLRMATNNLANYQIQFAARLNQIGGAAVGLLNGYLVAGFLICALQTLPWHQNFVDWKPRAAGEGSRAFPPDRVWLALMRHAGAYPFARGADRPDAESPYEQQPTFDRGATFELRYLRHRRFTESTNPLPYMGEFEHELHP